MNHFKRGAGKMTQLLKRLPYKWMKSRFLELTEKSRHSGTCSLSQRWSDTQADPWSSLAVGPVYLVKFQANDRPCLRQKVECVWTRMTPQALGFNVYTCSLTSNVHTCMHTPSHTRAHKHTCTLLSPSPKILFFLSLRSQPPICLCVSEVALWDMSVALTGLESTMEIRLALNLWHAFFLCFVEYWDYRHMPALWLISSVLISLSRQKWWRKY